MEEQKQIQNQHLTFAVRQSKIIVITNLILVIGGLIIAFIVIGILLRIFNSLIGGTIPTVKIMSFLTFIIFLFGAIQVAMIIANWRTTFYIIRPREFTIHKGIFTKTEEKFELNQVEKINIIQSFIGKIFNYGSIDMSNPISGNVGRINNIPEPSKYEKIILQPAVTDPGDPINYIPKLDETPTPFGKTTLPSET